MASKKTGRLAGLAALAGAAYMASKGKEAAGESDAKSKLRQSELSADTATPEEGESAQSKFRKSELDAGDVAAMAPRKVSPTTARPSAPPAGATQRFAPADSPVLSSGAGSGGPRTIGLGRSSGRGGAEAGEEATYNAEKRAQALKDFSAKRPGIVARMREKDKAMMEDGGKSMVDRQDAGAKRAGLSVDDYYESGKAQIDKQDGNFKRGGKVKKMASGGMTSSASKRADGIATKGKTRGKMC